MTQNTDFTMSEIRRVQKLLRKVKTAKAKIKAEIEEDELIEELIQIENNEISKKVVYKETFDMNSLELM